MAKIGHYGIFLHEFMVNYKFSYMRNRNVNFQDLGLLKISILLWEELW